MALRTITGRDGRCVMGVGMKMEKVIEVGMLGTCRSKVNMLVIMLTLGEMVVQHWPKERREEGTDGSDHDKPMTQHHSRGCSRRLCIPHFRLIPWPSVWGLSGFPMCLSITCLLTSATNFLCNSLSTFHRLTNPKPPAKEKFFRGA
jgi:hypothetical protein